MKRGGDIARRTPLTARVGLRARSRKMAAKYAERRRFVAHILSMRPRCEAAIEGICGGRSTTVHEILSRARGGAIVPSEGLDPRDVAALCLPCHSYVEDHPAWPRANGWMRFSWEAR